MQPTTSQACCPWGLQGLQHQPSTLSLSLIFSVLTVQQPPRPLAKASTQDHTGRKWLFSTADSARAPVGARAGRGRAARSTALFRHGRVRRNSCRGLGVGGELGRGTAGKNKTESCTAPPPVITVGVCEFRHGTPCCLRLGTGCSEKDYWSLFRASTQTANQKLVHTPPLVFSPKTLVWF